MLYEIQFTPLPSKHNWISLENTYCRTQSCDSWVVVVHYSQEGQQMDQEYVCKEQLAPPCQKLLHNWKLLLYVHSYIPICQQFLP